MNKFIFGTFVYEYQLIRQDRKTLSLTVTPDLRIIVKCPKNADSEKIEQFLQRKWFWLEKQLSLFKKYQRKTYKKEYISGEGYLYLGRHYKILIKRGNENSVSLSKGQLIVYTTKKVSNSNYNKKIISNWINERSNKIFQERLVEVFKNFDYKERPTISIREMKRRWGSFLNKEKIFLNPKLVHVSKDCIDYVIAHELCHFKYKKHNVNFYRFLREKYPNWEKTKDKLEMFYV